MVQNEIITVSIGGQTLVLDRDEANELRDELDDQLEDEEPEFYDMDF